MSMTAPGSTSSVEVNLFDHDVLVDPYPTYTLLREHEPVHWDDRLRGWLVTRYRDVRKAHLDPETFSSNRLGVMVSDRVGQGASAQMRRFMELAPEWMLFRDPPDHTRVRGLLNPAFDQQSVRRLGPLIGRLVSELVDEILDKREFDLVADFAYRIPGLVLAAQYGLPKDDAARLTDWWYEVRNMQRVFLGADPDVVGAAGCPAAIAFGEMTSYLADVVEDRTGCPREDLATELLSMAAPDGVGAGLDEQEMFAHLLLLPLASFGTTMDLIGNGLLGLLTQRDQWDLLVSDAGLIPRAVDEVLRYDASVQLTHRLVTRDVDVAGTRVRAGELVYLVRGSANRDPERFPNPDRIDVGRRPWGHVGFGMGIHHCLGSALARVEVAAAYTALASRIPGLQLSADRPPRWKADTPQFRGLTELPAHSGSA